MPTSVPQIAAVDVPPESAILDVREDDEWSGGHVPDAIHIPMGDIPQRLEEVPDASPLYVICRSGGRSARVAQFLNVNGWDAVNVDGGMQLWAAAGRPMVADGGEPPTVL